MSVANLVRYSESCEYNSTMTAMNMRLDDNGKWVKFEDVVKASSNNLQQLKAEIAAAVVQFDACDHPVDFLPWLRNRIDKWRQLSAV